MISSIFDDHKTFYHYIIMSFKMRFIHLLNKIYLNFIFIFLSFVSLYISASVFPCGFVYVFWICLCAYKKNELYMDMLVNRVMPQPWIRAHPCQMAMKPLNFLTPTRVSFSSDTLFMNSHTILQGHNSRLALFTNTCY